MLVAKAASFSDMPTLSISSLGAVTLVPTSMPTWHMMPKNDRSMNLSPSSEKLALKLPAALYSSSRIFVRPRLTTAITATAMNIGNITRQLSNWTAPQLATSGAMKEQMAFTNWPKVMVLASLSPETMLATSGLSDTCMIALPIPSRQKEIVMVTAE